MSLKTLTKANARQIALLINQISVAALMINDGYSVSVWEESADEAVILLAERFGIELPQLEVSQARRRLNKTLELRVSYHLGAPAVA